MPFGRRRQELVGPALELVQRRERRGEALAAAPHAVAFHDLRADAQAELPEGAGELAEQVVEIEIERIVAVVGLRRVGRGIGQLDLAQRLLAREAQAVRRRGVAHRVDARRNVGDRLEVEQIAEGGELADLV